MSSSFSTPAVEEYQADWVRSTIPELDRLSRRFKPRRDVAVMRSSQIDAERLDEELSAMLREQLQRCFALFRPGLISRLQPEITLLLDFLVFRLSVWEGRPLPGMALMNLRFRDERAVVQPLPPQFTSLREAGGPPEGGGTSSDGAGLDALAHTSLGGRSGVEGPGLSRWQRGLYGLGAVLLRYAWVRGGHAAAVAHWGDAAPGGWRQRGWAALCTLESAYRAAALLNFLAFLRNGRYRSLLERLLRARAVYAQPTAARAISFEYLNRQLVWHELSELLLFLLPLLSPAAVRRTLRTYLPRLPALGAGGGEGSGAAAGGGSAAAAAAGAGAQEQQEQPCGICGTGEVLVPYTAQPCSHRFCYYCLRSHCLADPGYTCPRCLTRVGAMQRCR
eukprot:scaffold5.g872.t1